MAARCIFCDLKDVLCASILLYHFRIFERRFGSAKFVVSLNSVFEMLSAVTEMLSAVLKGPWSPKLTYTFYPFS